MPYSRAMIDRLRSAVEALNEGNPEPFASLFAGDAEWRGVSRGFLWWKHAPSWRGPDEARAVLQFQIEKRGFHGFEMGTRFTQIGGDKIIGSSRWVDADRRQERYHVLTVRDGLIADMQVCGSWRQAKRFANRTLGWHSRTLAVRAGQHPRRHDPRILGAQLHRRIQLYGAAWESNPPSAGLRRLTGFEDRLGHRAPPLRRGAYPRASSTS
jgi:hypothetical protein